MTGDDKCQKLPEIDGLERHPDEVMEISSEEMLYRYICQFDYDGVISELYPIIENPNFTRNVALKLFYLLDGYSFLSDDDIRYSNELIYLLTQKIYHLLLNNKLSKGNIKVAPEFTKVQVYQLLKKHPNLPNDIQFGIDGTDMESNL